MPISLSGLTLIVSITLSLFLGLLNFWFWMVQREDRTPLWLAAWLSATVVFALCRLLQYSPLSVQMYILVPRILLTVAYSLVWLAYELGNSFIAHRPSHLERALVLLSIAFPIILLWTSNLVLTDQAIMRVVAYGDEFTGVRTGILYLPTNALILVLGGIPVVRLACFLNSQRWENLLMAAGFSFIMFSSLFDFIATALNLGWIRLSDFSYLLVAIFFCYIQVQRFGRLYRGMDVMVRERTAELSQANETLRTSEVRYRNLIDTARDIIFSTSVDGMFTSINPAFEAFTGWSRDEWLGRLFDELIDKEDRPRARDLFNRILRSETLRAVRLHVPTCAGGLLVVELNMSPQIQDGKVAGLLGIARDITDEQHAQDALKESEARYKALMEQSVEAIYMYDVETKYIVETNPAFLNLLGYTAEETRQLTLYDIVAHSRENIDTYFRQVVAQRFVRVGERQWRRKDGTLVDVEVTIGQINQDERNIVFAIARDMAITW